MKIKSTLTLIALALLTAFSPQLSGAQGTAFKYQGQLQNNGSPASGTYSLTFSLFNISSGGNAVAGPVTTNGVIVTNGLFSVLIDFGSGVFTGQTNWLQIAVETNLANSFSTLTPRQQLTPTPYAIYAENGGNAAKLASGAAIGAGSGNAISTSGTTDAFIGGGGQNQILFNSLDTVIGGGQNNIIKPNAGWSVIAGGEGNVTFSGWSVISGGNGNYVGSGTSGSTIGGGWFNTNTANFATVAGGEQNTAGGDYAFVGGGSLNSAKRYDVVGGGKGNVVGADYSGIFTGQGNSIIEPANSSLWSFVGGGQNNTIVGSSDHSTIAGGLGNSLAYASYVAIGGGQSNSVENGCDNSTIAGGWGNYVDGFCSESTIGGGYDNQIGNGPEYSTPTAATIPGGANNLALGDYSFAAGNFAQANDNNSFVWSDGTRAASSLGQNTFVASATGGFSFEVSTNAVTISASGTLSVPVLTITGGSDIAEPFKMSDGAIPEGSVVIIDEDHPGELRLSDRPYDTRVAGVVSGANGIHPGIQMQQRGLLDGGRNVALTGRVYVQADASNGAIHPGDLLTTSATFGHAMRVSNHAKAQGAILGKAMTSLGEGKGMVLVLITLE